MIVDVTASDGILLSADVGEPVGNAAVVLLHSLGCSRTMWAPQIAALESDYRTVALDARGHGTSAAPSGDYAIERLGQDVLDVMDAIGVPAAHVCGISMGGLVAQWLAIHAPDRVRCLVLANTASRLGSIQSWLDRATTVRARGMRAIADEVLARFLGAAFRDAHPDIAQNFKAGLIATPVDGYAGSCAALRDADLTTNVGSIDHPTLVIGGWDDISTPPTQAHGLAKAIPGAELLMLNTAHLSNVEQPDAFNTALMAHFAGGLAVG